MRRARYIRTKRGVNSDRIGVALLTVDQTSGTVTDVQMAQSCGNAILDNSTLDALRRWCFKPGGVTQVGVPISTRLWAFRISVNRWWMCYLCARRKHVDPMRSGRTAKVEEFEEIVHRFEIPLFQYA